MFQTTQNTKLDKELENAKATLDIIPRLITHAMKLIDAWLEAQDRMTSQDSVVMCVHADKIRSHSVALAERIADLDRPSTGRVLLLSGGFRVLSPECVVETKDAYDETKINNLDDRDIRDAIEFDTELKDMFGLAWIDDELRIPLHDALHMLHDQMEDGVTNIPGTVVKALKALLKGHPRGFGRYYTGTDPWPRPSAEVQAEIDARMPDALDWLRYELKEALEQEAATDGKNELVGNDNKPNQGDLPPSPGYLPIEADDARRQIEAGPAIDPDHLGTLNELKLLLESDAEKTRVFCGSLDQEGQEILNDLLEVAIGEIEQEHATVVGVVNVLILRMLDIRVALHRDELGLLTGRR